jgi:hypothetical protein
MPRPERDHSRIEADQTQILSHPVRLAILGLFTRDADRSLAADALLGNRRPPRTRRHSEVLASRSEGCGGRATCRET